jgi:hypothetical protein
VVSGSAIGMRIQIQGRQLPTKIIKCVEISCSEAGCAFLASIERLDVLFGGLGINIFLFLIFKNGFFPAVNYSSFWSSKLWICNEPMRINITAFRHLRIRKQLNSYPEPQDCPVI